MARKLGTMIGGTNQEDIVHLRFLGGSACPSLPQVPG